MSNPIIIVNGKANAGKDTFIRHLKEISDIPIINFSLIDPVKELFNKYNYEKDSEYRLLLQNVLIAWMNTNRKPLKLLCEKIDSVSDSDSIIFCHIRQAEYIDMIKKHYKERVYTLHIESDFAIETGVPADECTLNYEYDYYARIDNDISQAVKNFYEWLLSEKEVKSV